MFRGLTSNDGNRAVAICHNYDQHCPTVGRDSDDNVLVGSTLNNRVALLTPEEFNDLLANGAAALTEYDNTGSTKPVTVTANQPATV